MLWLDIMTSVKNHNKNKERDYVHLKIFAFIIIIHYALSSALLVTGSGLAKGSNSANKFSQLT